MATLPRLLGLVLASNTLIRELHPKGFILRMHIYIEDKKKPTQKEVKPFKYCGPEEGLLVLTYFDVLSSSGGTDEAAD